MRLASFNLENLFDRARVLNSDAWVEQSGADQSRWAAGKKVLDAYAALNTILRAPQYSAADKRKIVTLLRVLGLAKSDESQFAVLRQNRSKLLRRPRSGPAEVIANGRDEWIGWLDLKREAVNETATQNTARVVQSLDADVLAVVEAEDRIALTRFNDQILGGSQVGGVPYEHVMLVDGNDERGIDVGIFTRQDYPVMSIRSHVDDKAPDGQLIFSRDCAQYEVICPSGQSLIVLINHFKSKGFGAPAQSNARRMAQATRVREIYDALRQEGQENIAIVGDFNDTPDSQPLSPLLGHGSDLQDVSEHSKYESDGRPGTFANGTASNKIDYILLAPKLFQRVERAAVFRQGVWGGKNGDLFPHLHTITAAHEAASDHAAIWAEVTI